MIDREVLRNGVERPKWKHGLCLGGEGVHDLLGWVWRKESLKKESLEETTRMKENQTGENFSWIAPYA